MAFMVCNNVHIKAQYRSVKMIKAEVVFDEDTIMVNGRKFTVAAEYGYDTIILGEDGLDEYSTLEQAIAYCMEQSND